MYLYRCCFQVRFLSGNITASQVGSPLALRFPLLAAMLPGAYRLSFQLQDDVSSREVRPRGTLSGIKEQIDIRTFSSLQL
jgi:hypothetical protein